MLRWFHRAPGTGCLPEWAQSQGSLTAHLRATCTHFEVRRLAQGRRAATEQEAAALGMPRRGAVHAREVVLHCDGQPVVWARSAVKAAACTGPWKALKGLGTRPLAELLFQRKGAGRLNMRYTIAPPLPMRRLLGCHAPAGKLPRLARRSVFSRAGSRLVLTEVFFPDLATRGRPLPRCKVLRRASLEKRRQAQLTTCTVSSGRPSMRPIMVSPATTAPTPSGVPV